MLKCVLYVFVTVKCLITAVIICVIVLMFCRLSNLVIIIMALMTMKLSAVASCKLKQLDSKQRGCG